MFLRTIKDNLQTPSFESRKESRNVSMPFSSSCLAHFDTFFHLMKISLVPPCFNYAIKAWDIKYTFLHGRLKFDFPYKIYLSQTKSQYLDDSNVPQLNHCNFSLTFRTFQKFQAISLPQGGSKSRDVKTNTARLTKLIQQCPQLNLKHYYPVQLTVFVGGRC